MFISGTSLTTKKAITIPNTGWILLIIVAVVVEKNFSECTIKLWPIAVVKIASTNKYGNWDWKLETSMKNNTGIKTMDITEVWYSISMLPW